MDVMAAAAEKEAAGDTRDPSRGRPAQHAGAQGRAGRRARRARYRPHRLCRRARHSGAARAHRAPLSRQPTASRSRPSAWSSRPARRAAFRSPSWRASMPATAWRWPRPAIPPIATSWRRSISRPVDLPTSAADRFQPTVAALEKAGPIAGLIVASPSNPTGTMVTRAELKALADWCHGAWRAADLRRDLSRHRLRGRRGLGGRGLRTRDRGQQLLEVLLDDRLARRLAGRAAGAGAADRAADPELLHLGADAQPARRARRLRLPRRARRPCPPLQDQPRSADGRPARRPASTGSTPAQGAFYLYCRRLASHQRQPRFLQAHAGGGGRGHDARRRLRPRARHRHACASPSPARPPRWKRRCGACGSGGGCEAVARLLRGPAARSGRSPGRSRASTARRRRARSSARSAATTSSAMRIASWRRPTPR